MNLVSYVDMPREQSQVPFTGDAQTAALQCPLQGYAYLLKRLA
jgi:hypothetical protein